MWKCTINNTNGRMIESQSAAASDSVMLENAAAYGFRDVSIRVVTDSEHESLIAARDAAGGAM